MPEVWCDGKLTSTPFVDRDDRTPLVPENVRTDEGATRTGVLLAASCVCAAIWLEDSFRIPSRPDDAGSRAAMHPGIHTRPLREKYVSMSESHHTSTLTKFQT